MRKELNLPHFTSGRVRAPLKLWLRIGPVAAFVRILQ
jgi:hypothetical protein